MRSYGSLYGKLISVDNIKLALKNSAKGKRDREIVRKYNDNPDESIKDVQDLIANFKVYHHIPKEIYDGISRKKRWIISPKYEEQIVHHAVVNILKPILSRGMYYFSMGSIPKKGGHFGKRYIAEVIKKDKENTQYVFKMDIKKFFESVDLTILKDKLSKIIRDERFKKVLFDIIDVQEKGLPLGFYTSQWLANWFLTPLDHYIKEDLQAKYYYRYMDDIVIFDASKEVLHDMKNKIEEYLNKELNLRVKENWQVYKFDYVEEDKHRGRDVDYMGFRFFSDKTILRKQIMLKASRKANKISKKKLTTYDCKQIMAYNGWIQDTDSYKFYVDKIKKGINLGLAKYYISETAKKKNSNGDN